MKKGRMKKDRISVVANDISTSPQDVPAHSDVMRMEKAGAGVQLMLLFGFLALMAVTGQTSLGALVITLVVGLPLLTLTGFILMVWLPERFNPCSSGNQVFDEFLAQEQLRLEVMQNQFAGFQSELQRQADQMEFDLFRRLHIEGGSS